jgi:hypothetical protein
MGNQVLPLVPKDKLKMALIYEKEGDIQLRRKAILQDSNICMMEQKPLHLQSMALWPKRYSGNFPYSSTWKTLLIQGKVGIK